MFKDFASKVAHLVVDSDPEVTPVSKTLPKLATVIPTMSFQPTNLQSTQSPFAVPSTVTVDEEVYQAVLAKTDFDKTEVGKKVHYYFDALEAAGLDTATRFKSAISQATKLDNLTPDKILATFDSMKDQLQKECDSFKDTAKSYEITEIAARQKRLLDIDDQIAKLNQEKLQVSAELNKASMDHSNAIQQFSMATQRRLTEIEQQKVQFSTMMSH